MNSEELDRCLGLLREADAILMERHEYVIAAHLSMAVELLAQRVTDGSRR